MIVLKTNVRVVLLIEISTQKQVLRKSSVPICQKVTKTDQLIQSYH